MLKQTALFGKLHAEGEAESKFYAGSVSDKAPLAWTFPNLALGLDGKSCAQEALLILRRLMNEALKNHDHVAIQSLVLGEIQLKQGRYDPTTLARDAMLHRFIKKKFTR